MQLFLNRTQLARRLQIAPQTLRNKIKAGVVKADAKDERGNDLFELSKWPLSRKTGRAELK
jgi:hypothetical protein